MCQLSVIGRGLFACKLSTACVVQYGWQEQEKEVYGVALED